MSIISDSSLNTKKDEEFLVRSLEDLLVEKTFNLSLIKSTLIDQVRTSFFLLFDFDDLFLL